MSDACDVCVVGGGAAGLVAAITAAEAGARVVVLERDLGCGRTILATGNGRCNFCNVRLDPERYNQPEFVAETCGERWLDDVLGFFRESGMRWALEGDRLYPVSRQAASVRNVLLARARRADVVLAPAREVESVGRVDGNWQIRWRGLWEEATPQALDAHSVVLAVGGSKAGTAASDVTANAAASEGSTSIAGSLGLPLVTSRPALTPLACEKSLLTTLDGRRAQVVATLYRGRLPIRRERGEALLRSYGLSGIVIFDLSRTAEPGDVIALDLVPDVGASEVARIVDPKHTGELVPGALDGLLDPIIAAEVERLARERWRLPGDERMDATEPATNAEAAAALVKGLPFRVTGVAHPELAQVARGGIDVSCLDAVTLGVHDLPGLFACGEAVDVDGDCGGFNLAWAWKSGMVAGTAAVEASR